MKNLYSRLNSASRFIFPGTPLNPKLAYGAMKACARRALRDLAGVAYGPDHQSVNISVDELGFLLCGIPKVATTTFMRELVYDSRLGHAASMHSCFLGDLLARRPALRDYHKLVFVRNPWARVVSVYNSKICAAHPSYVASIFLRYRGLRHRMPFEQFVSWLCTSEEGADDAADRHWISQHRFFQVSGQCLVDHIAKVEAMDEEWRLLGERLGIDLPSLGNHSLKTSAGGLEYRSYYTDRTADLVAQRYATDIELCNYEF